MDNSSQPQLYTIGHSNHELDQFLRLLKKAPITALADVRSRPYSGRHPQYNRPDLEQALAKMGVAYLYFGESLGGRPDDPDLYDENGRVNYERQRKSYLFQEGMDRLFRDLEKQAIVLFCAEEDPLDCHRGLMITPAVLERGPGPVHVRGDGRLETTAEMEDRLLTLTRVGEGFLDGLFAAVITPEERRQFLAEAYRQQARKKAFRIQPGEEMAG